MSNYDQNHDFAAKDAINAPVVGAEFQEEFDDISEAIRTKADLDGATFTGTLKYDEPVDGATADEVVNVAFLTTGAAGSNLDVASIESRSKVIAKTGNASANNVNNAGYVFSGDNDSGLFNPEDGRVTVAINGTNRLSVTSEVRAVAPLVAQSGLVVTSGQVTLQGNGTGRITGVGTVSSSTDAANKNYVDSLFSSVANSVKNIDRVGSLVYAAYNQDPNNITYNSTVAGSKLTPAGQGSNGNMRLIFNRNLPGTWRCLGYAVRNDSPFVATLFVRIS